MVTRVKVGSNVVPLHIPAKDGFNRNHPVVRHSPAEQPHGDARLPDSLAGQGCQLLGQRRLATCQLDNPLDGDTMLIDLAQDLLKLDCHMSPLYNTDSVIDNNTHSVFKARQTSRMPKAGKISEFWRRLTVARESCTPPRSMNQDDIAKEYGYAFQSAITKWKTGGPDGTSMPDPAVVTKMAIDYDVSFEWLWSGRGDMRPLPATHPIVRRIVEVTNSLPDDDAKIKVLEAAIAQQTLQIPAVAARFREVQDEAKKLLQRPAGKRRERG